MDRPATLIMPNPSIPPFPSPISDFATSPRLYHEGCRTLSIASSVDSSAPSAPLTPKSESPLDLSALANIIPPASSPSELPSSASAVSTSPAQTQPAEPTVTVKRSRGRPRKHPVKLPGTETKVHKGRSKTGCITCRRRKKKCDESKPTCLNCEKNGVACEGYKPPELWQGGQRKNSSDRRMMEVNSNSAESYLQQSPAEWARGIIMTAPGDHRQLLDYFRLHLCPLLWSGRQDSNPFCNIICSMAESSLVHGGALAHAVIAVSIAHLMRSSLSDDSSSVSRLRDAHHSHYSAAVNMFQWQFGIAHTCNEEEAQDDQVVAFIVIMTLHSAIHGVGDSDQHSLHLNVGQHFLNCPQKSRILEFRDFYMGFFWHYNMLSAVLSPSRAQRLPELADPLSWANQFSQASYSSVPADLIRALVDVSVLRRRLRTRREQCQVPIWDYQNLGSWHDISNNLQNWTLPDKTAIFSSDDQHEQMHGSKHEDAHSEVGLSIARLYHRCAWVYLHTTLDEPQKVLHLWTSEVSSGISDVHALIARGHTQVLSFPLFILSCSSIDPEQRSLAIGAFTTLEKARSFGNIKASRAAVETVWHAIDKSPPLSWHRDAFTAGLEADLFLAL